MVVPIVVISTKIIFMAKDYINGVKIDNTLASGQIIRWTAKAPWFGKIRGNILVGSKMIIDMDGERWNGLMERNMMENGVKANRMEQDNSSRMAK